MIHSPFPWENSDEYALACADYMACAYNAAVNFGSERAIKKMGDLIRAINHFERVEGHAKLTFLMGAGVIDGFNTCPDECVMRPGGLFHAPGCENDSNSEVSRARHDKVREMLPERLQLAAWPHLVGRTKNG